MCAFLLPRGAVLHAPERARRLAKCAACVRCSARSACPDFRALSAHLAPTVFLAVYSVDRWDMQRVEGYGCAPVTSSLHTHCR